MPHAYDRLGQNKIVRVGENSGPFLSRLWTKVHEILGQRTSYFPTPLPNRLCHFSFSRYSPLSLEVVEKPNKCKRFLVPIFGERTTPTVLRQIVSWIYRPPFGKVWSSSVCLSPSANWAWQWSGMQNLRRVGENSRPFEAVCGPKWMSFLDDLGDPCSLQRTCPLMYILFYSEDIGR